jgi:DNA repair protein RadC
VVLLHNHPSGNPEPSSADLAVTLRIRRLGDELGIILLDHIIIGDDCYVSLAERGYLNREI